MKRILLFLFAIIALGATQTIEAKGVIVYHNGPTFKKTHDLPADEKIEGTHVNFGIAYEQFGLFWLPLWNYGETQYALVSDNEEKAWLLDSEDLEYIKTTYNLDIAEVPSIPFMTKVGLKPIAILLIVFIIWGYIPSNKKEEEEMHEDKA